MLCGGVAQVQARTLEFPPDFDPLARDLVERLLIAAPDKRLGANGFHEIKDHPYFKSEYFDTPGVLGRLFPSLQELCIRRILKRFHASLVDMMDKERQDRYRGTQASERTSSPRDVELPKQKSTGSHEKRTDSAAGDSLSVQTDTSPNACRKDDSSEPDCAESSPTWPATYIGSERAQELLDQVVPREVRGQPKTEMSPHLRILIDRLEYCLRSHGRQFSKECMMADEWDRKHAQQHDSSDVESSDAKQGGRPSEQGTDS